jgi:predicted transcriptional regulator
MPHGNQKVSDEQILTEFRKTEAPYLTAGELAQRLSMTRQGIHDRLLALHESGEISRKKTGRTVGWWVERD